MHKHHIKKKQTGRSLTRCSSSFSNSCTQGAMPGAETDFADHEMECGAEHRQRFLDLTQALCPVVKIFVVGA